MEVIFDDLNKKGLSLSKKEIDKAKSSVAFTIDDEFRSSQCKQIYDVLKDGPSRIHVIAKIIGTSESVAHRLLRRMEANDLVYKEMSDSQRHNQWAIKHNKAKQA